jgi:hypothetical protein
MILSEEEKQSIQNQILKAKSDGHKLWADFEATKEKKDFVVEFSKLNNFSVETDVCPRKLWTIIVRW